MQAMPEVTFKQLSITEWDAVRDPFDFHIRLERDEFAVDVFDNSIENPDEAYITSHECDTWEQVVRYCQDYDGETVI
jgi:hypothetical protein